MQGEGSSFVIQLTSLVKLSHRKEGQPRAQPDDITVQKPTEDLSSDFGLMEEVFKLENECNNFESLMNSKDENEEIKEEGSQEG